MVMTWSPQAVFVPKYGQKLSTLGRAAGSFRGGAEVAAKNVDLGFLAPFFFLERMGFREGGNGAFRTMQE